MRKRKMTAQSASYPLPSIYRKPDELSSYLSEYEHDSIYAVFFVGLVISTIVGLFNGQLTLNILLLVVSAMTGGMASIIIIYMMIDVTDGDISAGAVIFLLLAPTLSVNSMIVSEELITPYVKFIGMYSVLTFIAGRVVSFTNLKLTKKIELSIRTALWERSSLKLARKAIRIHEDDKASDDEKLDTTLTLVTRDIKKIENRSGLNEFRSGLLYLKRSIMSTDEIKDDNLRAEAKKCAAKIIRVYYNEFLHLSSLYQIEDTDVIDEELSESDSNN